MASIEVGELIYEYTVAVTGITEFGASFAALLSGEAPIPPEGARFDVHFEGESLGPKVKGKVKGIDHLYLRPDGRMDLNIHGVIETHDGHRISLFADGVCEPTANPAVANLRENATLFTSSPEYAWVNRRQVWGVGEVDLAQHVVRIRGYSA